MGLGHGAHPDDFGTESTLLLTITAIRVLHRDRSSDDYRTPLASGGTVIAGHCLKVPVKLPVYVIHLHLKLEATLMDPKFQ